MTAQYNHYIKETFLTNWLINEKFYYLDKLSNTIQELGKRQSSYQFTSLLINQKNENAITTCDIENKFEQAVVNYISYNNFIHPKSNIPISKLEDAKDKKINQLFNVAVNYFSLQLTRNPFNTYKYFPDFKKGVEEASHFLKVLPEYKKNSLLALEYKKIFDNKPEAYKLLFDMIKSSIPNPTEFYFIKLHENLLHLSEGNTTSLSKLFGIIDSSLVESQHKLNNIYLTVLSPSLILLMNCNEELLDEKEIQELTNKIDVLWNNFVIHESMDKIIIANQKEENIQMIKFFLNINSNKESILKNFKYNENIYKEFFIKKWEILNKIEVYN